MESAQNFHVITGPGRTVELSDSEVQLTVCEHESSTPGDGNQEKRLRPQFLQLLARLRSLCESQ